MTGTFLFNLGMDGFPESWMYQNISQRLLKLLSKNLQFQSDTSNCQYQSIKACNFRHTSASYNYKESRTSKSLKYRE